MTAKGGISGGQVLSACEYCVQFKLAKGIGGSQRVAEEGRLSVGALRRHPWAAVGNGTMLWPCPCPFHPQLQNSQRRGTRKHS
ncbi:hypothetical protein I79_025774 [Cricetulus griseus]|uniref:Uncharacterized protein n=1 Tax=Cricetulus griseus TaxID=10029 RepID=G3IP70_CRIGR|nr:hypothetical protein I79_025774 [Cricetulus griseus]